MKFKKNYQVLFFLCILSVIIHFLSFFPSVINHDESTYLVIAQELLHGKTLFVDIIDVKPIGIFLIMALLILVFSNSVFMLRLFTSLVIAFTVYLVFKVKLDNGAQRKAAIYAAVIYIFMMSVFTFYGVSVNTETYFNLFTISGLFFLLRKNNIADFLTAGILLGCGFIVKYVVLFDFLAFVLFIMILNLRRGQVVALRSILQYFVMGAGFLIPFGTVNMYYYKTGHYNDFFFHTFEISKNYPVQRDAVGMIKYVIDFHVRFLPVIFFFYYCLFDRSLRTDNIKNEKLLVIIWVINKCITKPIGYMFMLILTAVIILTQKKDYIDKPDYPRQILKFLETRINENDVIYTGN